MLRNLAGLLALVVLVVFVTCAESQNPARPSPPPPSNTPAVEAAEALQQMLLDLRQVRGLAGAIADNKVRKQMEQLLDQVELKARRLGDLTAAALPRTPLAKPDFDKLFASMKREPFDEGRFSMLRVSAEQAFVTSDQARALVGTFVFGPGQKKAAIFLHARLTDPVNFPTVLSVLPFDSDRKDVLRAVSK